MLPDHLHAFVFYGSRVRFVLVQTAPDPRLTRYIRLWLLLSCSIRNVFCNVTKRKGNDKYFHLNKPLWEIVLSLGLKSKFAN